MTISTTCFQQKSLDHGAVTHHEPTLHSGFLRLPHIIGDPEKGITPRIPVSRSTWYEGIKRGKYPKPIRLSEGVSVWRVSDIDELCRQIEQQHGEIG